MPTKKRTVSKEQKQSPLTKSTARFLAQNYFSLLCEKEDITKSTEVNVAKYNEAIKNMREEIARLNSETETELAEINDAMNFLDSILKEKTGKTIPELIKPISPEAFRENPDSLELSQPDTFFTRIGSEALPDTAGPETDSEPEPVLPPPTEMQFSDIPEDFEQPRKPAPILKKNEPVFQMDDYEYDDDEEKSIEENEEDEEEEVEDDDSSFQTNIIRSARDRYNSDPNPQVNPFRKNYF